jgi:hypothetical protein
MISPGVTDMNIPNREITVALATRTRNIIVAKRAILAAATIKMTTMVIVIVACLVVLLHAMYA